MRNPIDAYLQGLHKRFEGLKDGAVADYIPELGRADPELFGICLATADGRLYEVGDTQHAFTIQSMSKPFTYGLALQSLGHEAVSRIVDVEPSGDAFNSISLEPGSGRPRNPMINAGAIATASLVSGPTVVDRFGKILETYSRYAGRPLTLDEQTFASERDTGHRNRAIGHMLRSFDILDKSPEEALEVYFRQCSVAVDCRDVALMAATLANGGRHPITDDRVIDRDHVQNVLSVMTTCGMYDGSGRWFDQVGLPAKSGVAGGILAVLPGQFGLCVFSPPLDAHGNSVRGVAVCRAVAAELGLHSFRVARASQGAVRTSYDLANVPSRRRRPKRQRELLAEIGGRARVWELHGDILFAGAEAAVRDIADRAPGLDLAVIDFTRVSGVSAAAQTLLDSLDHSFLDAGKELLSITRDGERFATLDDALEHAEQRLLEIHGESAAALPRVDLAHHSLCAGVDAPGLSLLDGLMARLAFESGTTIFDTGDAAKEIFLLVEGEVSIEVAHTDGGHSRVVTLLAGSTFGELAVLGESTRTAAVRAYGPVVVRVLTAETFAGLSRSDPQLQAQLLRNMLETAYDTVSRMSGELSALRGGDGL